MNHDGESDPTGLTSLLGVRAARLSALPGLSAYGDVSWFFKVDFRWNAFNLQLLVRIVLFTLVHVLLSHNCCFRGVLLFPITPPRYSSSPASY